MDHLFPNVYDGQRKREMIHIIQDVYNGMPTGLEFLIDDFRNIIQRVDQKPLHVKKEYFAVLYEVTSGLEPIDDDQNPIDAQYMRDRDNAAAHYRKMLDLYKFIHCKELF